MFAFSHTTSWLPMQLDRLPVECKAARAEGV